MSDETRHATLEIAGLGASAAASGDEGDRRLGTFAVARDVAGAAACLDRSSVVATFEFALDLATDRRVQKREWEDGGPEEGERTLVHANFKLSRLRWCLCIASFSLTQCEPPSPPLSVAGRQ